MKYFICLFAAGVAVFPFYIIIGQVRSNSERHKEELLRKSLARGHEATAKLQRAYSADLENPRNPVDRWNLGKYQFEYNGHLYKIRLYFSGPPPMEVQVYWLNNPKKASTSGSIKEASWPWLIAYIVVFLVALWIMK